MIIFLLILIVLILFACLSVLMDIAKFKLDSYIEKLIMFILVVASALLYGIYMVAS